PILQRGEPMDRAMRGRGRANSNRLVVPATILVVISSLSIVRGKDESDDGTYGTALAVTGMPIAFENSGLYALGLWGFSEPSVHRGRDWAIGHGALRDWFSEQCLAIRAHGHGGPGYGTLGYGGYGMYSGYYGFGLSFHLGYGYGGRAFGTGAEGGFPYYGGIG